VSTTHTIAGGITGTGLVRNRARIRWPVARSIVWAWLLTLPGAAALGAVAYSTARAVGLRG
jgi:PiT family inorganic phosphate transporter